MAVSGASGTGTWMKKIALFIPSLDGGGAERVALFVAEALAERGYGLDLVVARPTGALLDDPVARRFMRSLDAANEMLCLPQLIRYLRGNRPDLLLALVHSAMIMAGLACLAVPETRLAISVHNALEIPRGRRFWPRMLLGYGPERRLYRNVVGAHAVSHALAAQVGRQFHIRSDRIVTIYNPVPARLGIGSIAAEHESWFDRPVLMTAGRLVAQKDHATMVDAFARSGLAGSARLLILGEGELRNAIERQVESLGLAGWVLLPGFLPDVPAYLARSAGFALSSRHEGFGIVLIEALAAGIPVASFACPTGPEEILAYGGRLLRPGDIDGLAQAMRDMVSGRLPPADPSSVARLMAAIDPRRIADAYADFVEACIARR